MKRWQFIETDGRLVCGDEDVRLTPKAAAVLGHLVRRKGALVDRQSLIDAVWPGLHVTPDLVREYIFDLRTALGDDAKEPQYIETVRGKGFRLIDGIDLVLPPQGPETGNDAVKSKPTIAILRADCSGEDSALREFMDSVAEEIAVHLTRGRNVAVISRYSSYSIDRDRDLRKVAEDLNATYLLASSATVSGDVVRTVFQLLDGQTGTYLWVDRKDHRKGDLGALTTNIAGSVVDALTGWNGEIHRSEYRLIAERDDAHLNAYQHLIRATELELHRAPDGMRKALGHLEECLRLDPSMSRAWMMKSVVAHWLSSLDDPDAPKLLDVSGEAIERAHMLDPHDPNVINLLVLKRARDGELEAAQAMALRNAAARDCTAEGYIAISVGLILVCWQCAEARAALRKGFAITPPTTDWHYVADARLSFFLGQHEHAISSAKVAPR
ncbi:MAG: winged helix-turn-helix domain-containing protein, partial [Pseudomonadota bacterium]